MASSNEEVATVIQGLRDRDRRSRALVVRAFASKARAYYELSKPNLSGLVVITGVIGFYLGSVRGEATDWWRLVHLVTGTGLTASGACALNMFLERDLDRSMRRTRSRPVPSGRAGPSEALAFALGAFIAGFVDLALFCGPYPAVLSLLTLFIYAFVYTPMKRRGPIAIWIGAIPGAIPPVMGWTAVRGELGLAAAALFAILFVWQLPHFLALAWMYRDDYARAGLSFLPRDDTTGRKAGLQIALGALALVPVSLLPAFMGMTGGVYLSGALLFGLAFFIACARFWQSATHAAARSAFLASVTYLPALLALMLLDRIVG